MYKRILRDYLTFNRRERNGTLLLLGLLAAMLIARPIQGWLLKPEPERYDAEFYAEVDRFLASRIVPEEPQKQQASTRKAVESTPSELFRFNPNAITAAEWSRLGFKDWQIRNIEKYKSKGGQFRVRNDLAKIYGLDAERFNTLKPFIALPDTLPKRKTYQKFDSLTPRKPYIRKSDTVLLALNLADTLRLTDLKGIGAARARRIARYRERLGGFVSVEQLFEVWGLDSSVIEPLRPHLKLQTGVYRTIDLNRATKEDLQAHPYINWNVARAIVAYRKQHGPYQQVSGIQDTDLVSPDLYGKIAPYLKVSPSAHSASSTSHP